MEAFDDRGVRRSHESTVSTCDAPSPEVPVAEAPPSVARFSTDAVEQPFRLDYWIGAVSDALAPVEACSLETDSFNCSLSMAGLHSLTIVHATGSQQDSFRTKACLARDVDYSLHLMADFGSGWMLRWRGTDVRLRPGDLILTDSRFLHSGHYPRNCSVVNIKIPPVWASAWLSQPERLAGRCIAHDVGWGRVLSSFVAQLTPQLVLAAPLPPGLIADNLGSLLSLAEADLLGKPIVHVAKDRQTHERIQDVIRQRASEAKLTAADVAAVLNISERTLHRSLAGAGKTFAALLLEQRIALARRMLEGRHFDRLSTGEIGARAGFSDPSHFVRAATRHLGNTPARHRAASKK